MSAGTRVAEPDPATSRRDPGKVIQVLAAAEQPLRAREIHAAVEKLAGTTLSWTTVKDCLHKHAQRPDSPIERVSHGTYRHI